MCRNIIHPLFIGKTSSFFLLEIRRRRRRRRWRGTQQQTECLHIQNSFCILYKTYGWKDEINLKKDENILIINISNGILCRSLVSELMITQQWHLIMDILSDALLMKSIAYQVTTGHDQSCPPPAHTIRLTLISLINTLTMTMYKPIRFSKRLN